MVAVKDYNVRISFSDGEMILEETGPDHGITFMFGYVNNHSIINLTISITVIDINGERSNSTVVERSISDMPKSSK